MGVFPGHVHVEEAGEYEVQLSNLLEHRQRLVDEDRLSHEYRSTYSDKGRGPYDWQVEFHAAGSHYRDRAIIAGNRTGKTWTAGAEFAIHLTGRYPDWWVGHRFKKPILAGCCGVTYETIKRVVQSELFGDPEVGKKALSGTGWVPKRCIADIGWRSTNISDVAEAVMVRHVSGGVSRVDLLSYEMDHHKFQGFKWDLAWLDEEPAKNPLKIFTEIMTRLVSRKGLMMFTRTPLFGLTPIVKHYLYPTSNQTWHTGASMDDAPHLDEEAKSMLLDSLPLHERETRRTGKILLGSGNIYPVTEDMLSQAPFEVPRFFRKVVGIDFGANHPFACVKIAYDADNDCVYVVDAKKVTAREAKESSAQDMLAAVHSRMVDQMCLGVKLPVSWPHDGMNREKGTGIQLIESYRECGLNCLPFSARYKNEKGGPQSREPIIQEMLERMQTGRLKVFAHLKDWFDEMSRYHRDDKGKVVPIDDDLLSATHYALMMLRFAATESEIRDDPQEMAYGVGYDPLAV